MRNPSDAFLAYRHMFIWVSRLMKKIIVFHCIAFLTVSSITAWGRIGETLDECIARYGEPKEQMDFDVLSYWKAEMPETKVYSFVKGNVRIDAVLHNGTAQMLIFRDKFIGPHQPLFLDDERIDTIISRNVVSARTAEQSDTSIGQAIAEEPALTHYFGSASARIPIRQCYIGENDVNAIIREDTTVYIVSNSFIDEMRDALRKGRAEQESEKQRQLQENQKALDDL